MGHHGGWWAPLFESLPDGTELVSVDLVMVLGTPVVVVSPMMMILIGVWTILVCASLVVTMSWSATAGCWCSSLGEVAMSSMIAKCCLGHLVSAIVGMTRMCWS